MAGTGPLCAHAHLEWQDLQNGQGGQVLSPLEGPVPIPVHTWCTPELGQGQRGLHRAITTNPGRRLGLKPGPWGPPRAPGVVNQCAFLGSLGGLRG